MALALYDGLTRVLAPAVPLLLRRRADRGKEEAARLGERYGLASVGRPNDTLIWIHAASVGESLAALPLISALLEKPARHALVTTGTVTSAKLMAERLPPRALHQYLPLDARHYVRRFLDHWRPDLALFVESELWPNLILETHSRGLPMALVNARLSDRSFQGWRYAPALARRILSAFDIALAQDAEIATRLSTLGAPAVKIAGSLKADAPPLPVDEPALAQFRNAIGTRPVFLAASTHPGEEEAIIQASTIWREKYPDGLTIIVPRHPQRGSEIETLVKTRNVSVALRSSGAAPAPHNQIYVADTLGELGLFYRAAPFAFLGGSLVPHGGQNPLEPAQLGTAVLTGPHTHNFESVYRVLLEAQGEGRVHSVSDLATTIARFTADPNLAAQLGARAKKAAKTLGGALSATVEAAEQLLMSHARA